MEILTINKILIILFFPLILCAQIDKQISSFVNYPKCKNVNMSGSFTFEDNILSESYHFEFIQSGTSVNEFYVRSKGGIFFDEQINRAILVDHLYKKRIACAIIWYSEKEDSYRKSLILSMTKNDFSISKAHVCFLQSTMQCLFNGDIFENDDTGLEGHFHRID